jgi:thioredoxin-dependent peroxiredoxin
MKTLRLLIAASIAASALAVAADIPAEGSKAPDFTLKNQEGRAISLHDYNKGKWVVLYFYPKDQTRGCTIEAHNFQRDIAQYDKVNTVILGVSVDTVDSHKEWCAKDGMTFKLLADDSKEVTTKYGLLTSFGKMELAKRVTFLIDPKGVIRKVYPAVDKDIPGHSAQILADLGDLQKTE